MGRPLRRDVLSWKECKEAAPSARLRAVEQLLNLWERQKGRTDTKVGWGDKLELTLCEVDSKSRCVTLVPDQKRILREQAEDDHEEPFQLKPDWASYVVEAVPGEPYGTELKEVLEVEENIRQRRLFIESFLGPNQKVLPICVFPRVGASPMSPNFNKHLEASSDYFNLGSIIPERKQRRAETHLPVFLTEMKPSPFFDTETPHPQEDRLFLDGMGMGLGACSIQVTVEAESAPEARWLHDQLVPLGPLMLALTAATPAWKGHLVDCDTRWKRYAECVDDRTYHEKHFGLQLPRWDSNQIFVSEDRPEGVDRQGPLQPFDDNLFRTLVNGGMDETLATHYAAIISRDPINLTPNDVNSYEAKNTNVIKKFHNAVWPTVNLKPPVSNKPGSPAWRVEFRPMEIQMSDFDNAAFSIFTFLVAKAISHFHLNFYVPIDQINESMENAQSRDAVNQQRFWFRRGAWPPPDPPVQQNDFAAPDNAPAASPTRTVHDTNSVALMTASEIVNGEKGMNPNKFPGLVAIIFAYLRARGATSEELEGIQVYLRRVADRAAGHVPTPAQWMRWFVLGHRDYQQDGMISEGMCHDMIKHMLRLNDQA